MLQTKMCDVQKYGQSSNYMFPKHNNT